MPLPVALAIGGLAVSAVGSIAQAISGASRASKARKALENYQRQELRNVTEGLRVSTLGAELQTQEAQRRFATSVDALRSGGVRGLVGGLGQQEQLQQQQQAQISADLDRQQMAIEQMRAQEEMNIRSIQEARETQEIAGIGSEIASGRQMTQAGISGLMDTGLSAGMMASDGAFDSLSKSASPRPGGIKKAFGFGSFKSNVDPNVRIKNINRGSLFGGGLKDSFISPLNQYNEPYKDPYKS